MYRVLQHRHFGVLFLSQVLGLLATGIATVALGLLAYAQAGQGAALVLGTALAIKMVAYVVVSPLASAFLGSCDPKKVLLGANAIRVVAAALLVFASAPWQLYVIVFLLQSASACFTPTLQATLPRLLPNSDDYTSALALSRLASDLEQVLTPALAAITLLILPGPKLFIASAVGFGLACVLLTLVALPSAAAAPTTTWWQRATLGSRLLWQRRALRPILALNAVVAAAGSVVIVHTVVIVKARFGLDDSYVALLLGMTGAGSMTVSFLLPALLRRVGERRLMLGGAWLLPVLVATVALALAIGPGGLAVLAVLWFGVGAGWSAVETPVGRLLARHLREEELPAGFAGQFAASHACWLVAYPLCGWLGSWNLNATIAVLVLAGLVSAGMATRWWRSGELDSIR